jgi:ribosomal protein S18 acetylase RimI-like enzyme
VDQQRKSSDTAAKPEGGPVSYRLEPFGFGRVPTTHDIALLHKELLPESPISKLGIGFMEKFYYSVLPQEGLIFGAVAYVDDKPAAFISATSDAEGFMARGARLAIPTLIYAIVWSAVRQPRSVMAGVWEALRLMRQRGSGEAIGEILSFGVRTEFRDREFRRRTGLSIVKDLLASVTERFQQDNLSRARVVIDRDNRVAQALYGALGGYRSRDAVPGWRVPSVEMMIDFEAPRKDNAASESVARSRRR